MHATHDPVAAARACLSALSKDAIYKQFKRTRTIPVLARGVERTECTAADRDLRLAGAIMRFLHFPGGIGTPIVEPAVAATRFPPTGYTMVFVG